MRRGRAPPPLRVLCVILLCALCSLCTPALLDRRSPRAIYVSRNYPQQDSWCDAKPCEMAGLLAPRINIEWGRETEAR